TLMTMQSQLQQLSTIGAGNVFVQQGTGTNLNVFTVTFIGTLAGQEQNLLTATATNGTRVAIAEQTPGALGYTTVTGGIAVAFQGALGGVAQVRLTADASSLLGTAPGISVATTTAGGGLTGASAVQTLYFD